MCGLSSEKSRSILPLALILLFGGFALNTTFMLVGIHGYLRELTRFTTIAGLALTIIAVVQIVWRAIAMRHKKCGDLWRARMGGLQVMVKKTAIATAVFISIAWLSGCGQRPVIEGNLVFVKYAQIYKYSEGKIMRLTRQGKNYEPEISPDGQWVAFTSIRDNKPKTEVYLMDINGDNLKQITHFIEGKGRGSFPRWKDNENIFAAYSVNIPNIMFSKEGNRIADYWNPGIDSEGFDVHFDGLARFSPDKKYRLAYSIFGGWGKYIRIIQSEDEEHGRELISLQPKETSPDPRFSPDSTRVLYTDGGDIKYFDVPSMKEVIVKKGNADKIRYTDPCWSPDGKHIAVSKIYSYLWGFYQRSYIVVMNIDGTNEQVIARGAQPDWGK